MSTPYAAAPAPYFPSPPPKKRPSGWWFGVGGVLLLIAAVSAGAAAGMVIHFFASDDATSISMRGVHRVDLPAHTHRMTLSDGTTESCVAREANGPRILFHPLGGGSETERNASDFAQFDTGDGHVVFLCFGSATDTLWITQVPHTGKVVLLIVLGAVVPLVLGGVGLAILLVITILWITRGPRPAPYPGPPGY